MPSSNKVTSTPKSSTSQMAKSTVTNKAVSYLSDRETSMKIIKKKAKQKSKLSDEEKEEQKKEEKDASNNKEGYYKLNKIKNEVLNLDGFLAEKANPTFTNALVEKGARNFETFEKFWNEIMSE